tara:strand:+ start:890 stop:1084 length:195 start_codon:yes stop_codon:yes gene_type:complete
MKVGDLVQRCSTGKIDIVIDVVLGAILQAPSNPRRIREWLLLAGNQRLVYASNYEVISESEKST